MNNQPPVNEIRKGLEIALKEYDKLTILDIVTNEVGGWSNGAEVLNNVDPAYLQKNIFSI